MSDAARQAVGEALCERLSAHWSRPVRLIDIRQIPGGASRETYRVAIDDAGKARAVIMRRDPATSLIDTERRLEYRTYEAVFPTSVPVPEPLLLAEDAGALERPYSVMAEVPDCQASPQALLQPPFAAQREHIGEQKWRILGTLASLPLESFSLDDVMTRHEHPAAHELEYWASVVEHDAEYPHPVAAATLRWLRRHLPPPASTQCLVHGDFRSGNFLFDERGTIHAVLDWEMAHYGDPLEDLAWSLDPLWSWHSKALAGGLLPRRRAIEVWEAASGMRVDAERFRWWQVFASFKALGIWISSIEDFMNGQSKEPILAMAGWPMADRQQRILIDRLRPDSAHDLVEALI